MKKFVSFFLAILTIFSLAMAIISAFYDMLFFSCLCIFISLFLIILGFLMLGDGKDEDEEYEEEETIPEEKVEAPKVEKKSFYIGVKRCPNCGAPITDKKCPYCQTQFDVVFN